MKKIVFIPADERPCNYNYPKLLCDCADGYRLVRPPLEIMGDKKIPPDYNAIHKFITDQTIDADILIMSIDTLLYGGLIPSRNHFLSLTELKNRANLIQTIKTNNPKIKIYSFITIMRCPTYSTSEEEPEYYKICGEEIYLYGVSKHKHAIKLISDEEFKKDEDKYFTKIAPYINEFENRREINLKTTIYCLDLINKYCDFLVLPQDDSSPFGYTAIDQIHVKKALKERNMNIEIYPGSDEVGVVLLARALADDLKIYPEIEVIYPKEQCKTLIPMYEDRAIEITLNSQLNVIGFIKVQSSPNKLFMNYPTRDMVNMGSQPSIGYKERDLEGFTSKISEAVNNNYNVMICDAAYGNGGEKELLISLRNKCNLFDLTSYAGWNTSSNTLGTALAQGMIRILFGPNENHRKFLALRVYEDIGYMGAVRWHVWHDVISKYGYCYEHVGGRKGIISEITKEEINEFMTINFPEIIREYRLVKCEFPWKRIFEVELKVAKN